jgi:hypothetical protein
LVVLFSEPRAFSPLENKMDGALAQLVERNTGSVEVSGSTPLGSTISFRPAKPLTIDRRDCGVNQSNM